MKTSFANKLKELREEKGLTKTQLGNIFHVSRTTVYHWEQGDQQPSLETLVDIALFFEVPTDYILGLVD